MTQTYDSVRFFEDNVDQAIAALRLRRDRLDEDKSICLQLEASLVELTHENETTARLLDNLEQQLTEKRLSFEKKTEMLTASMTAAEEALRQLKDRQEVVADEIDEGWRVVEEELRSLDNCHAYEVSRLKKSQKELEEREGMLREKLRSVGDREKDLAAAQRRLRSRETLLQEMNRASLERKQSELVERESFLHDE